MRPAWTRAGRPTHRRSPAVPGTVVGLVLGACLVLLAGCSGEPADAVPPPPQVDDAEVNDARYRCLLDKGFPVTRGEQGEVVFTDPEDEQASAYEVADQECTAQLVDAGLLQADSPDSLRAEYLAMSAAHSCLVAAGFPLVDWPSEDVFVDAQGAFNVLEATAPVSIEEARAACTEEFAVLDQP